MKSLEELSKIREKAKKKIDIQEPNGFRIMVGLATCGIAAGATPVFEALKDEVKKKNLTNVEVVQTGCIGVCTLEPLIEVYQKGKEKVTYVAIDPEKAKKIIEEHIINGNIVSEYVIGAYV